MPGAGISGKHTGELGKKVIFFFQETGSKVVLNCVGCSR